MENSKKFMMIYISTMDVTEIMRSDDNHPSTGSTNNPNRPGVNHGIGNPYNRCDGKFRTNCPISKPKPCYKGRGCSPPGSSK